ncbi:MAG: transglutaminase domain-containing protein [Marinilabiliaceae bacterium]|nr:transglutaminase domain-containing protein [Marinilabiliaceae bacterium]
MKRTCSLETQLVPIYQETQMKITLIAIIWLFLIFSGYATEKTKTGYTSKIKITSLGKTEKVQFKCLIPNDIQNIQKVLNIEYSIQPKEIITENENKYAIFIFDPNELNKLVINVDMEIYRYDFSSIKKNLDDMTIPVINRNAFLIAERYIDKNDPLIKTVAPRLITDDTLKTVMNIFNFVQKNLSYSKNMTHAIGAKNALKSKKGDCSEFSDLFVTLCRANNIPSRVVKGMVTNPSGKNPLHAWAEVYTGKFGWIRVEPTTNRSKNFASLDNKYIQLTTIRNDKILNNNEFIDYTFWGDPIRFKTRIKPK